MNYNDHALSPVEDGWERGQPGGPLTNTERDPEEGGDEDGWEECG